MNPEERLEIVRQMQLINDKQLINRQKALELSKELEKDVTNDKIRDEIKRLEKEFRELHEKSKELLSRL